MILGLLGEEKTEPKKKKKVRLYSRRPCGIDQYNPDLLDFYEPDIVSLWYLITHSNFFIIRRLIYASANTFSM